MLIFFKLIFLKVGVKNFIVWIIFLVFCVFKIRGIEFILVKCLNNAVFFFMIGIAVLGLMLFKFKIVELLLIMVMVFFFVVNL